MRNKLTHKLKLSFDVLDKRYAQIYDEIQTMEEEGYKFTVSFNNTTRYMTLKIKTDDQFIITSLLGLGFEEI